MFGLLASSSRSFHHCSATFLPALTRSFVNRALTKPIPPTNETITTPNDFLKSIGRSMETKMTSAPESWDDFWRTSGLDLRKAGLSVRDRRYTLWCMSKFRRGIAVGEFAHEPKPQKTVRGWGPSVQNGKRIRSKRPKNEKRK
ncbi:IGR protein motif-domain-containing protein [Lentinula guzmanii]|uniref:Small ribosomal subunit protein mS41 n=2 Tax=Lentinula TaxID=5352 RepID=A0AA38JB46_9AGAR|nr:IGR protein motif-domain-containing protein [Lentinula guzmanii]KAJ3785246.1 IGR protein motif-domain-containing protein [Lentinula aff. detonsa]